ncbi:MAG: GntR family transcriptional regulator [Nocardioidaceae bacterium]|nr:GntR family transcriptional regulator [Nocardioidaceae bacterium]MCL2615123.1 GntR family transcriptional regulator [Nocardioidaceae bacterium]
MPLTPVDTLPLSEQIHRQLLGGILDGSLTGVLPSERELAETFGVNRHAVREAIKRLQQGRLVAVNQGGATRVQSVPEHAGLDLLPSLIAAGGPAGAEVAVGVLELRASIGADAVRFCAERSASVGADLLTDLPDASIAGPELDDRAVAYWTAIVTGAQSLAIRLAYNTLLEGIAAIDGLPAGDRFVDVLREESRKSDELARIARLISEGDGDRAAQAARDLMTGSIRAARALVSDPSSAA